MMLDLSPFRAVRVDPVTRRAWVAGGTLLGQLDHESLSHGLVTTMGTVSHTGVGGLTTGGGFGRLARKFGLAIDNLLSVDVVTADGAFRHASKDENPDLFWGVRGGGGNFGVVTTFEFRLHPMNRKVIGGDIVFPIAKARDVLNFYADYSLKAPDDLYLDYGMVLPPGGGAGAATLSVCYAGPESSASRALDPIRKLGTPLADNIKSMDYADLQRSGDVSDPRAMGTYLKSGFTTRFTPELIRAIVEGFEPHPARATLLFTQHCGGAIGRVAPEDAAFAHRDAQHNLLTAVAWKAGDDSAPHMKRARDYWATLEPFTAGWYVNEVADESAGVINANYRQNYKRLVEAKTKYDPTNLFRLNANVKPAG
jgi:FAD/FMN-containing dehydrogenase